MTTVCNQPVSGDTISGNVGGGTKSKIGDRACFLGSGVGPNQTVGVVTAGTLGGATGPGSGGLPGAATAVATLTSIDKKRGY